MFQFSITKLKITKKRKTKTDREKHFRQRHSFHTVPHFCFPSSRCEWEGWALGSGHLISLNWHWGSNSLR